MCMAFPGMTPLEAIRQPLRLTRRVMALMTEYKRAQKQWS